MKSIIIAVLMLITGLSTKAQNQNEKINIVKSDYLILVINNKIIANPDILNRLKPENILKIDVLKDSKLSSTYLFLNEKFNKGIIKADINNGFESKTQKEVNTFFGLDENNDIYVNGYLIENKEHSFLSESIKKIEILKSDNIQLKKPSLNITIE